MKDIVAHCDKIIVKTEDKIKDAETHLKNITERKEYQSIEKTIKDNEANTKHLLQQIKFKKFNYLKYKQNSTTKETLQPTKHKTGFQKTYASVVQGTNNTNTNVSTTKKFSNTNAEKESETLLNKLKTLNAFWKTKYEFWNSLKPTESLDTIQKTCSGLHSGKPGHKQHRNNECTYLYPINNGNTIGIQPAIKSKIRYKSDP